MSDSDGIARPVKMRTARSLADTDATTDKQEKAEKGRKTRTAKAKR